MISGADQIAAGESKRFGFKRLISRSILGGGCLTIATGLFILNIVGVIIPLRNPDIYHESRNLFTNDITLTAEEFWNRVPKRTNESIPDYATRMTETVADGIAHLQVTDRPSLQEFRWEIPIWENYLLWASRHAIQMQRQLCGTLEERGSAYRYQFSNYRRAVERGVGLCTTHCIILMGILKEHGVHIQLIGISERSPQGDDPASGHSITRAEVAPGKWWILDPDFGVVLPFDLVALRENPSLIEPYYTERAPSKEWIETLKVFYADPHPAIFDEVKDAQGHLRYYFGISSYYLIWIIPAFLLVAGFVFFRPSKCTAQC